MCLLLSHERADNLTHQMRDQARHQRKSVCSVIYEAGCLKGVDTNRDNVTIVLMRGRLGVIEYDIESHRGREAGIPAGTTIRSSI